MADPGPATPASRGPNGCRRTWPSGPPDEKDPRVSADDLRADLRRVLAVTHFTYNLALVRENSRRRVLKKLLTWTLGLCVPLLLAAAWLMGFWDLQLAGVMAVVMFFGCLGAYVSIQRRLQNTSDGGDPVFGILALHEFNSVLHFPLIAGGVFAVSPVLPARREADGGHALPSPHHRRSH